MKIVDFSLYQFINEQDSILFFEQYIQKNEKESIKGIQFKEHIKSKLRKGKIIPIKDMRIAQSIEIWSFFENISNFYIPCLFEGKLEDNKIYFVTSRNQKDIFDCAFINLIKKEIIFIKITTNEEINNEVFNRKKLKKKIKKAKKFLTGKIIEENIKLNVGFCFIFLKYIINNNNEQEYMNDANKKILDKMISINEHLEKMINKCDEQNLKYCLYKLPNISSKHNKEPNYEFIQINKDDEELYILKNFKIKDEEDIKDKNNEDTNVNDNKKYNSYKKKRNYMNMMFDSISLEKINLNDNLYIREFYNFYTKRFKIKKKITSI